MSKLRDKLDITESEFENLVEVFKTLQRWKRDLEKDSMSYGCHTPNRTSTNLPELNRSQKENE